MHTLPLDQPAAVHSGQDLDTHALGVYLQRSGLSCTPPLRIRQYPHGFSNLTFQVADAVDHVWILRAPPLQNHIPTAHDVGREYRILSGLQHAFDAIPTPLDFCTDETVLGRPFFLMEYVPGTILRADTATTLLSPATMTCIAQVFVHHLVRLHAVDLATAQLTQLGHPQGYVERQVRGWYGRYKAASTADAPDLASVAHWLADRLPASDTATLIHNDYKYDNVILDPAVPTRIRAVLDWEMATVGDPLMDLGTCLAYWIDREDPPLMHTLRHSPTWLPGNPSRTEVVEQYARESERNPDNIVFYFVFGHLKLATILQQLYLRWVQGHTTEPRYARLIDEVRVCARIADQAMRHQRIDRLFPT